jgi:N-acetylneuraminic acid mutarotase
MPTARWELASGVVGGKLYALGGFTSTRVTDIVEAYDPSTNTWATKASMPHPRFAFGVSVAGGALYAVDGCCDRGSHEVRTLWAFNP